MIGPYHSNIFLIIIQVKMINNYNSNLRLKLKINYFKNKMKMNSILIQSKIILIILAQKEVKSEIILNKNLICNRI